MEFSLLAVVGPDWASNWLTPIWILGVGVALGLVALLVIWLLGLILCRLPLLGKAFDNQLLRQRIVGLISIVGLLLLVRVLFMPPTPPEIAADVGLTEVEWYVLAVLGGWLGLSSLVCLCSRRTVEEIGSSIREGALWPILIVSLLLVAFAILGTAVVRRPMEFVDSIQRLPAVGTTRYPSVEIPGRAAGTDPNEVVQFNVDVSFRRSEIKKLVFRSTENLVISTQPAEEIVAGTSFDVRADEEYSWTQGDRTGNPFVDDEITGVYVQPLSPDAATLQVTVITEPQHPEVWAVPITAAGLISLFLLYLIQRSTMPKLSAIALATLKSEMAQPVFLIILIVGALALLLFLYLPYNTFGEDIKVLKDNGLTLIMVLCIVQAVWAASTSVSEEIEGRTALTVLSKPVNRRSFIVGKFLGITWTVALLFLILGIYFLVIVAYKPIYDAKESSQDDPTFQLCFLEMILTVPGLVLAFLETVVLASISVAISTRVAMLANFLICASIYLMGHLTPLIVQSSATQLNFVAFTGKLLAVVFPNLNHFNVYAAVAAGRSVPPDYLGWALVYCLIYSMIAMLLALLLFEDRDLA